MSKFFINPFSFAFLILFLALPILASGPGYFVCSEPGVYLVTSEYGGSSASDIVVCEAPVTATAAISATPSEIEQGESSVIRWSSTNASACVVTPPNWTGTSGEKSTGPLFISRKYTVSCEPSGEENSVSSVFVKVAAQKFNLNVSKTGQGRVTGVSNPTQIEINCGATCAVSYEDGTIVTLTAVPDAGRVFAGWSGACDTMERQCVVKIDGTKNVRARFLSGQDYQEF